MEKSKSFGNFFLGLVFNIISVLLTSDVSQLSKVFPLVEMVFGNGQKLSLSPENYLFRVNILLITSLHLLTILFFHSS